MSSFSLHESIINPFHCKHLVCHNHPVDWSSLATTAVQCSLMLLVTLVINWSQCLHWKMAPFGTLYILTSLKASRSSLTPIMSAVSASILGPISSTKSSKSTLPPPTTHVLLKNVTSVPALSSNHELSYSFLWCTHVSFKINVISFWMLSTQ